MEIADCVSNLLFIYAQVRRCLGDIFIFFREEFVQRWIQQSYDNWQACHNFKQSFKILLLHRLELSERFLSALQGLCQNHLSYCLDPVAFKEHVLCPAEANAFGAKSLRNLGIMRSICIGLYL